MILKPGTFSLGVPGKKQPGGDVSRFVLDLLVAKGVLTTDDCCTYTVSTDALLTANTGLTVDGVVKFLDYISKTAVPITPVAQLGVDSTGKVGTIAGDALRAVTASATIASTDDTILFTGSATSQTLTLPAPTFSGKKYWIKNGGANSITVAVAGSRNVDSATTATVTSGSNLVVVEDVTNNKYWVV